MLYVVVIEKDGGDKDYKVFSKSADAIRRHETALHFVSAHVLAFACFGDLVRRHQSR